jgi:S-adenosylmethionine/arginine decarboxylase-like enzyme
MSRNSKKQNHIFGYQLLLDLYDCRSGVSDDIALCYQFLDEAVEQLGMQKQAPPYIFKSDETRFPDKAGLSGWVPLIESSIVIHTLSLKNFISVDIYCCRAFKNRTAKEICQKFFKPTHIDEQFIERGLDYYRMDTAHHTLSVKNVRSGSPQVKINKKESKLALK